MSVSGGYLPPRGQDRTSGKVRIIEDQKGLREQLNQQRTSIEGAPWVSGVLAAVQSLLFGLAIILIPVLTTSAVSTTLVNQDFEFGPSFGAGIGFWGLGHGGQIVAGGATVTAVPLGLTVILLLAGALSVRRTAKPGYVASLCYAATYMVLALVIAMLAGTATFSSAVSTLFTTALITIGALTPGLRKRQDAATYRKQIGVQLERIPSWVRVGLKSGAVATGLLVLLGALVLLVWFLLGMDRMTDVLGQWSLDAPSGAAMGVAQIALVPNLLIWATAWSSGATFMIGQDTAIALTHTELGPLPALPMLGALPNAPAWPAAQFLLPALVVASCIVGGILFARYTPTLDWKKLIAVPVIATATVAMSFGVLFFLSSGAAGPGRLSEVGVPVFAGMGSIALLGVIGFFLITLVTRPEIRSWVTQGWQRSIDRVTRVDEQDYVPARSERAQEQSQEQNLASQEQNPGGDAQPVSDEEPDLGTVPLPTQQD